MTLAVDVRELTKSYQGRTAIDRVSFSVLPGESVALLGPNGSGKTTTLRCIAGLTQPDSGEVEIRGLDLRSSPTTARTRFSFLPQEAEFPETLTARELIGFHAQLRGLTTARADEALEEVGIGVEDQILQVRKLSGGMRHRLSLAVASLSPVDVMLLDEPTANLDPEAALQLREKARRWQAEGRTLIFSTHVLSDVEELADSVIVLVNGRVLARESVSLLRDDIQRFAELRVDVGSPSREHLQAALKAGATEARLNSHSILLTAPVESRFQILKALQAVSAVHSFESKPFSVETLYLKYVSNGEKR